MMVVLAVGVMAGLVYGDGEPTPLSYTRSIEENFDSIGPTGTVMPAGWMAGGCANAEETDPPIEQFGPEALTVHDGTTRLKGSVLNLGTTGDPDRAVGQAPTSASNDRGIQVALRNDTGAVLTSIVITYTGEQWRDDQATPGNYSSGLDQEKLKMFVSDKHDFSGYVEDMGSDFFFVRVQNTGAAAGLDGNDPANRTENIGGEYTFVNPIPAGGIFYLSWFDWENNATHDHILAIDDVLIGTSGVATAPIPQDGGWALTDLAFLEWLRPEPLVQGETVLVNVYFGSVDPNLIPGKHGTILVVGNYDGDSTDQFGRPLDLNKIYYWRVDVIDPNGGLGDVIITGNTWSFTTTVPPEVIVAESDGSTEVSEEGETSDTYTISLSKAPASPVTVTIGPPPVFVPIAASGDDAEENQGSGSISRSSSDLEMPYDGSTEQIIGLYFLDIQIPRFATITSATVEFKSDSDEPEDVWLTIWGRLDDPGSFQQDINWMISTPGIDDETAATVEWTMVDPADEWVDDGAYLTPDLSAIIQEIVDQSSWDAGRALAICVGNGNSLGTTPSSSQRRAESWNGTSYGGTGIKQPILRVEYTMDQITWVPPVVVLDGTNWEGEDVTVTAVDDSLVESDPHTITLENVVTSASADWDALPADDVVVSIIENDCGSWGFAPVDINKDCVVDLTDLAEFASQFGRCTDPHFPVICNDLR